MKNIFGQELMKYSWVGSGNPLFGPETIWATFGVAQDLYKAFLSTTCLFCTKLPCMRSIWNTHFGRSNHRSKTRSFSNLHSWHADKSFSFTSVLLHSFWTCGEFVRPFQTAGGPSLDLHFPVFTIQSILEDKMMHNNNRNAKLLVGAEIPGMQI